MSFFPIPQTNKQKPDLDIDSGSQLFSPKKNALENYANNLHVSFSNRLVWSQRFSEAYQIVSLHCHVTFIPEWKYITIKMRVAPLPTVTWDDNRNFYRSVWRGFPISSPFTSRLVPSWQHIHHGFRYAFSSNTHRENPNYDLRNKS